jgi:hypothetical protein
VDGLDLPRLFYLKQEKKNDKIHFGMETEEKEVGTEAQEN